MSRRFVRASVWVTGAFLFFSALAAYAIRSRRVPANPTVAVIPPATGSLLWEVEHFGAKAAAEKLKYHLYWNAPTSENDSAGQISLIDRVSRGKYQGLIVAPNHAFGVRTPLRHALAAGLPVVIVSAPVDLPPSDKLGYIVNDDELMGELAAAELAKRIQGSGSIALVGLTRYGPGIMRRVRGAENLLARRFPGIHVAIRGPGAYDASRAEGLTRNALNSHPALKGILSFTAASTRGVHAALKARALHESILVVGCEQDADLLTHVESGEIAAVLAENTYRMGYEAVEWIADSLAGKPLPARRVVPPLLITRQNLNSPEAKIFTSYPR